MRFEFVCIPPSSRSQFLRWIRPIPGIAFSCLLYQPPRPLPRLISSFRLCMLSIHSKSWSFKKVLRTKVTPNRDTATCTNPASLTGSWSCPFCPSRAAMPHPQPQPVALSLLVLISRLAIYPVFPSPLQFARTSTTTMFFPCFCCNPAVIRGPVRNAMPCSS
jgi:hypothetical protein